MITSNFLNRKGFFAEFVDQESREDPGNVPSDFAACIHHARLLLLVNVEKGIHANGGTAVQAFCREN